MPPLREQILKTVNGYLDGFNSHTPEGIIANRSADCQHRSIPPSPHMPTRSNEEYQAFMAGAAVVMTNHHIELFEGMPPIIDEDARKAVVYLTSTADTPVGPYKNYCVFTFHLSADGTEIDHILEWADLVVLNEFMPKLVAWAQEHASELAEPKQTE